MALLPIHKYFVFNGEIKPLGDFIPSENEGGIYEVIRVVEGIPLFTGEHIQRFFTSARMAQKNIRFTAQKIQAQLYEVIRVNKVKNGNVLISCKKNLKLFFISHKYPPLNKYEQGVRCGLLHAERDNPNAKVFQTSVRKKANQLIQKNDFFEVLLVDNEGRISEGSRSNVFFIQGNLVLTPPGNKVLLGITRTKVIDLIRKSGFRFLEKAIHINQLQNFDAAFITGTSPKILPINSVGDFYFDPQNKIVQILIAEYNKLISDYIKKMESS